jgi:hypothetical protein
MEALQFQPRPSPQARCAVCHEAVTDDDGGGGEVRACEGCKTLAHRGCREQLGRCPTLGCAAGQRSPTASPELLAKVNLAIGIALGCSSAILVIAASAYSARTAPWTALTGSLGLVAHGFVLPMMWAMRRRHHDKAPLAVFLLQGVFAFGLVAVASRSIELGALNDALGHVPQTLDPVLLVALAEPVAVIAATCRYVRKP